MIRPSWFARSLPREWGTGRIAVDGDGYRLRLLDILYAAFVVCVIAVALAGYFG